MALWAACACLSLTTATAQQAPIRASLPNVDRRPLAQAKAPALLRANANLQGLGTPQAASDAMLRLREFVPDVVVDLDPIVGTPRLVSSRDSFLTDRNGVGGAVSAETLSVYPPTDPHRVFKAFLDDNADLFGFNAQALNDAEIRRDFVTPHNGLRTVVWQQTFADVPVFGGMLQAHITANDELVRVSSQFIVNPALAAATDNARWADNLAKPTITAETAVAKAAGDIGSVVPIAAVVKERSPEGTALKQVLRAPGLNGDVHAELVWVPMGPDSLRLCWRVFLVSHARGEGFRSLVDARSGEVLIRHNLTTYQSAAPVVSMSAYTSDSPSPFTPGWPTPNTDQPPVVPRTHLTNFSSLNSVASPIGWFYPATNSVYTTIGNNVDAHCDWDDNDVPDIPRPQVAQDNPDFTFPLDLSLPPSAYTNAAVVNLFYWNNFMHDKLYELGFTEAAGNFQNSNFGRGGFGGDGVEADAQDGWALNDPFGHANNANFFTPDDGIPGRMQMYIFNGPFPNRDGDLDAEVMCHEYTHGLSNRLVGNGALIYELQTAGMGEGWSDFYAMSLLSEASDDPTGNYPTGGYATFMLDSMTENYYFGIRRYPYSTDMTKNPLTFKDIDPSQADPHIGTPTSPIYWYWTQIPEEVHFQGEVWCATLWECRANLVDTLGWAEGNQTMLQLVTDGMKLSPANPTFLEARDAILQADLVNYGGANRGDLWRGFAKRGMGLLAKAPPADTTYGVVEDYTVPSDVVVNPPDGILEINVTPVNDATLLGGSTASVFVRVRDGVAVTNATVKGVVNGLTTLNFNNTGTAPDLRSRDSIYSASLNVPASGTNLTLALTITAPGKQDAALVVNYFIAVRPGNDLFSSAIKVKAEGATLFANNRFATPDLEAGEPDHGGTGAACCSLWWSWTPTANARVLLDSGGSAFNTLLGVYTGATVNNLKEVGSASTKPAGRKAYLQFDAKKGTNYFIAVASSSTNTAGQIQLVLAPGGIPDTTPPVVQVSSPVNGLIVNSNTIEIVATAFDPGPISSGVRKLAFQVKPVSAGSSIAPTGSTQSTNRVALVEGRNTVSVTAIDGVGNVSDPVTVVVNYRRQPVANDHFAYATVLNDTSGAVVSDNREATREPGEPKHAGNDGGHSLWWKWTAPADGSLLLSTDGSKLDTLLGMYTGNRVDSLHTLASNDDAFDGSKFSKLQQGVRANQTYYLAVDGFNGSTGQVQLAYSFTPGALYTIDLQTGTGGSVSEHGAGPVDVPAHSSQTLTAIPDPGFVFAGWEGAAVTTANPLSLQVNSNITVRANFYPVAYTDDFETGGLGKINWVTTGTPGWSVTSSAAAGGKYSARSGAIGNSQASALSLAGKFSAGSVAFSLKISSEAVWDYAEFLIDGVQLFKWSGEADWSEYSFPIAEGVHTLQWIYHKDAQTSAGLDAVFVDNLQAPLVPAAGPGSAAKLSLSLLPQGQYELKLVGQTNQVYIIQQAAEILPNQQTIWTPYSTNVAEYGQVRFILDPQALNQPHIFFRAVTQ